MSTKALEKMNIIPQDDAPASVPQLHSIAPPSETAALMHVIERAARDPSVDMDKLERLLAMSERLKARNAEQEFNEALGKAQTEMRPVAADANNPQTKSKYASYLALDRAMRPIYTKHGFSISFNTAEGAPENCIRLVCEVALGGHSRKYQVDMPADGKGAKGGDVMTKTHAVGAAMTYGQRYLLKMIFNIAVGEDGDGNGASGGIERITQAQADDLRDLIEAKGANRAAFLKWAKQERIEDIPADHFEACKNAINNYQPPKKA